MDSFSESIPELASRFPSKRWIASQRNVPVEQALDIRKHCEAFLGFSSKPSSSEYSSVPHWGEKEHERQQRGHDERHANTSEEERTKHPTHTIFSALYVPALLVTRIGVLVPEHTPKFCARRDVYGRWLGPVEEIMQRALLSLLVDMCALTSSGQPYSTPTLINTRENIRRRYTDTLRYKQANKRANMLTFDLLTTDKAGPRGLGTEGRECMHALLSFGVFCYGVLARAQENHCLCACVFVGRLNKQPMRCNLLEGDYCENLRAKGRVSEGHIRRTQRYTSASRRGSLGRGSRIAPPFEGLCDRLPGSRDREPANRKLHFSLSLEERAPVNARAGSTPTEGPALTSRGGNRQGN